MNKKNLGNLGEKIVENYLRKNGYNIMERSWRLGHKEVDLIAYKDLLVAIEVKTTNAPPESIFSILKAKQVERIRGAMKGYCLLNNLDYQNSRLDLVIVRKNGALFCIEHHLDI